MDRLFYVVWIDNIAFPSIPIIRFRSYANPDNVFYIFVLNKWKEIHVHETALLKA